MTNEQLTAAIAMRREEVEAYQINITNYTMAIELIDAMPENERAENAEFRKQLAALLVTEKREQNKAKIMLTVLERQLAA